MIANTATESIKIGGFILDKDRILTYPDGQSIDLKKVRPVNIGIMPEGEQYVVTLMTEDAIKKIQRGITGELELIGFRFDVLNLAIAFHEILCLDIFNIERADQTKESNGTDNE